MLLAKAFLQRRLRRCLSYARTYYFLYRKPAIGALFCRLKFWSLSAAVAVHAVGYFLLPSDDTLSLFTASSICLWSVKCAELSSRSFWSSARFYLLPKAQVRKLSIWTSVLGIISSAGYGAVSNDTLSGCISPAPPPKVGSGVKHGSKNLCSICAICASKSQNLCFSPLFAISLSVFGFFGGVGGLRKC